MTDLAFVFDGKALSGDIAQDGATLLMGDGLASSVLLSLFSDARAEPDDEIPDSTNDPRGWWGDRVEPRLRPGKAHRLGSRLWLLSREKQVPSVLARVRTMITEALAWLIEDKVATAIDVATWFERRGWLAFTVVITKPESQVVRFRFQYAWGG
jgi:phage gp46-like protein